MGDLIQRGGARLVVGLGVTGISVVRFCVSRQQAVMAVDEKIPVLVSELQSLVAPKGPVDTLFGAEFQALYEDQALLAVFLNRFVEVIVSPGVDLKHPVVKMARQLEIAVTNDIAVFVKAIKADFPTVKFVAITGSNGKSTVTDATARLGQALGIPALAIGNIGIPVLNVIDSIQAKTVLVLELSSYQLELVDNLEASVAVLLNMSNDHLDRHGTIKEYWHAKQKIYEGARAAVVNRDDPLSAPLSVHQSTQGLKNYIRFGLTQPDRDDFGMMTRENQLWFACGIQPLLPAAACAIQGPHNQSNFLAVLAIAKCLGWPLEQSCDFLKDYTGLKYRCQVEATSDDIIWINDSKGTNVGATLVALAAGLHYLNSSKNANAGVWWIGGGLGKGADFDPIAQFLNSKKNQLSGCFLYGADQALIAAALEKRGITPLFLENRLEQVVRKLRAKLQPGDVVVFSPACASMDQFRNFEARGACFSELIRDASLMN